MANQISSIIVNEFTDSLSAVYDKIDKSECNALKQIKDISFDNTSVLLDALQEEHEQLERRVDNLQQQIIEQKKKLWHCTEEKKTQNSKCESVKDKEKYLKRTLHTIKRDIKLLTDDPLTENDHEKLRKIKKKLSLYEQCTGVGFDYSCEDKVKGFVRNQSTNYISTFAIDKDSNVQAALWQEVSKAGGLHCVQHTQKQIQEGERLN